MPQRTVCICDGNLVGIESIFTVVNGKQINIPNKVEALREKSRQNQLFCPCGCGANYILVAGDRNLREQHFRIKHGEFEKECHLITEGKCSVDSKIVLKCWLDDKLKDPYIQSRVPISAIDDTNRKYEFSFLSRDKAIAISYSYERANLSDEKFDILENNSKDIKIVYIVDRQNGGVSGQYPESLMKIQTRQGYCLYLTIEDIDYYKAELKAVFFDKNIDGFWQEIVFLQGLISEFDIDDKGNLIKDNQVLDSLCLAAKEKFHKNQEQIREKRERDERERAEQLQKMRAEVEKKIEELRKKQEEKERELAYQRAEEERRKAEYAEKQRIEREKIEKEKIEREAAFKMVLEEKLSSPDKQVWDAEGNRWGKCQYCGKIAIANDFPVLGGSGRVNLGICYECNRNENISRKPIGTQGEKEIKKRDPNTCPKCGGRLREIAGKYGSFMGCSNYPRCKYYYNIPKRKYF